MPFQALSWSGFFDLAVSSITGFTVKLTNISKGSASGAIVNSTTAGMLTLQNQAIYQVAICRSETSFGPDLWSFANDLEISPAAPLPASFAGSTYVTAPLTFGRYRPVTVASPILVGTVVQTKTTTGSAPTVFVVVADVTNPNYDPSAGGVGGYTIQLGQSTVVATVRALVAGSASNVIAGALSAPSNATIVTPGVPADYTTLLQAITNGADQETDAALRVRLQKWISSLAKGTDNAVDAAVLGVEVGLSYTNNDLVNAMGVPQAAFFTVVIDDGSGAPSPTLLANVNAAIMTVRSEGMGFTVIAPNVVTISVGIAGAIYQPGFSPATVQSAIATALVAYINALGVGSTGYGGAGGTPGFVTYLGILNTIAAFVGAGAGQGLAYEGTITLNGGAADIALSPFQLARSATANVTFS